jgi:hypothetical protein
LSGENQQETERARAALYIDGFNLYHAIDDLQQPFLKWSNYWRLGEIIIPKVSEVLVKVVYCTAYYPSDPSKKWRHQQVINAQKIHGVSVELGHYTHEIMNCRSCNHSWSKPTEKEGDINVAINLIKDAFKNEFDHAYLLTSDSDQAATARMFVREFPEKLLTTVAPPGRNFSAHIQAITERRRIALSVDHIEKCVMRNIEINPAGGSARRPAEYDPPPGWVHPDNRPKKTKAKISN